MIRLGLLILAVDDVARATRFYREALQVEQTVDVPVYAELTLPDGVRLGLYQREAFAQNPGVPACEKPLSGVTATELYFFVDDPALVGARLERAGARLLSALQPRSWGDEAAYYCDPDANVIVLARKREDAFGAES